MNAAMRTPPHVPEAERLLLLAAIVDGRAGLAACEGIVAPGDFYSMANRTVWEAALAVAARGHEVDHSTVLVELQRVGKLEGVGGEEYLLSISNTVMASEVETYAKMVRDASQRRALIRICQDQASRGYDPEIETQAYLQETEAAIFTNVRDSIIGGEIEGAGRGLSKFWEHVQACAAAGGILGVSTGIRSLDEAIDGLWDEDLIVVGGRPSMGKTALGETLFLNVAMAIAKKKADEQAVFFSAEMGHSVLWPRMLAKLARVNSRLIRKWKGLAPYQIEDVKRAVATMSDLPMGIDTTSNITISQIRSKARKAATKKRVRAIVVDYLQLVRPAKQEERRDLEVGEVARGLKELAKELHCPVIALAQVNRGVANRTDRKPSMSDIAESGKIEAHADTILLLHREAYYRQEAIRNGTPTPKQRGRDEPEPDPVDPNGAELIIAKARSGITGSIELHYQPEFCEFTGRSNETHF